MTLLVHILKGKDGLSIDFMALTMIDPASSWLEVVELPTITRVMTKNVNGKERTIVVLAGSLSQLKWRVSLRPDAEVSDDGLVCHHPILRPLKLVMALRSK